MHDIRVGYRTEIQHIDMPTGKPIVLETLSMTVTLTLLLLQTTYHDVSRSSLGCFDWVTSSPLRKQIF